MRKEQKQTFILSSRLEGSEKFKTYLCNTMPEDIIKLCRLDFEADFTGGYRITYQFYSDNEVMKEIIIRFFAEHTSVRVYVDESTCYRLKDYKSERMFIGSQEFEEFHKRSKELAGKTVTNKKKIPTYSGSIGIAFKKAREYITNHLLSKMGNNSAKFINSI